MVLSSSERRPLNVLVWGTYDLGKPRTRLLIAALPHSSANVIELHAPIWEGTEDKSFKWKNDALKRVLRRAAAYPRFLWQFLREPRPDVVVFS